MSIDLEHELAQLQKITDKLGMPIDDGIRLPVAVLRIHGFVTTGSCEGHLGRKTHGPYITLESPDAAQYEVKMRKTPIDGDEFRHLWEQLRSINLKERERLAHLLDEFYIDRTTETKLTITNIGPGTSRLICDGFEAAEASSTAEHAVWLKQAQAEFAAFADWLIHQPVQS